MLDPKPQDCGRFLDLQLCYSAVGVAVSAGMLLLLV